MSNLDFFLTISKWKKEINFILFHLYVYSPDSKKSVGDVVPWASNYSDLLRKISKYCCPVEMFYLNFLVL